MTHSVQLDPETEALLNRLAHTQHRTKSDVLRKAVHRLTQDEQAKETDHDPYALVADLIGIARGSSLDIQGKKSTNIIETSALMNKLLGFANKDE